jgi:hypothetical protein
MYPERPLAAELDQIARRCADIPLVDAQSDDEVLGYDAHGLPSQPGKPELTDSYAATGSS